MPSKIQAGQKRKPSLTEWNRHVEASDDFHSRKRLGEPAPLPPGSSSASLVSVKNSSGADRRRGEVLEFDDYILDDEHAYSGYFWFNGGLPSLVNGFGILLREQPEDAIDECVVVGACFALVNVTDAGHKFATVASGQVVLQSVSSGPIRILHTPTGTGEKQAIVLLGSSAESGYFAVTNATISHGGAGEVERIKRDSGAWVRSGETYTAHDIYLNTDESIEQCVIVHVVPYEGLDVIDAIYCAASDWLEGCTS